jgi:tetratricopeptide (TPR) repeat protein
MLKEDGVGMGWMERAVLGRYHMVLASWLHRQGEVGPALKSLDRAAEISCDNHHLLVDLASWCYARDLEQEADALVEKALQVYPTFRPAIEVPMEYYLLKKRFRRAAQILDQAADWMAPARARFYYQWAQAKLSAGQRDAALQLLETSIQADPSLNEARKLLQGVQQALGPSSKERSP